MAQHDGLYQRAVYYDIALNRDVEEEARFILECYLLHRGRPLRSVLEVACGPGYHARALAARGLRVVGIDLAPEMLAMAKDYAIREHRSVTWRVADMRAFALDEPVEMAVCLFDGVDALLAAEDFVRHLQCVADSLEPEGLYLIDCTHPRDCSYSDYGAYQYSGEREGTKVDVVWSTNGPAIDPVSGVAEVEVELHIERDGAYEVIRDVARERCFTGQELTMLAQLSGVFEVAAWYGDMNLSQPLDATPASRRMIAVLQRTS